MKKELVPGLEAENSFVVANSHLANVVGSGLVSVFSTAMMIAGMEAAAVAAVQNCLDDGQTTVGVHVDVWHRAPTTEGMKVFFRAVLKSVSEDGRRLFFDVEARDEYGLIGDGFHERAIVQKDRFESRAGARREGR